MIRVLVLAYIGFGEHNTSKFPLKLHSSAISQYQICALTFLKMENTQKHCFQSNLAESLKIAGNIFSCSPPPTHGPSQVSKSSKLVTICQREALQMMSDAWNTLSKLLYQYTFPVLNKGGEPKVLENVAVD